MAGQGRTLKVYLAADVDKFRRGLKGAETGLQRFRRNAGNIAAGIGAGVAAGIGAAAVVIGDAISKASDLNEAMSKSSVIFGDQAKGIQAWADGADRAMGLSQRAALDVASTFGALGKQSGMTGTEVATFAKQMAQMAGDLASFNNTSVEDAAAALASGLRGEAEPLRKYNINLSEAAVNAQALDMGLVKARKDTIKVKQAQLTAMRAQDTYNSAVREHGKDSTEAARASDALEIAQLKLAESMKGNVPKLTEAQKTVARTAIIMEQGADAVGDYAKTADGLANTQRTVASQIEDIQADFGTGFIEGLGGIDDAAGDAKDSLADMEENARIVGAAIGRLAAGALQAAANFALGLQAIPTLWDTWIQTLSGGVTTVGDKLGIISDEAAASMQKQYEEQIRKNKEALNLLVNPPTSYDTGSRLDTFSIADLYRKNPREADQRGRGDGRAAQKDARSRTRG